MYGACNNYRVCVVCSPGPRAEVYCARLNFNTLKLVCLEQEGWIESDVDIGKLCQFPSLFKFVDSLRQNYVFTS